MNFKKSYYHFRWRAHIWKLRWKKAIANADLTQQQVTEKIIISRQTISNCKNWKSLPDIINIINLSDLYQISIDKLLKEDKRMKEKLKKDEKIAKIIRY